MSERILGGRVLVSDLAREPVAQAPIGEARRLVTKEDAPCSVSAIKMGQPIPPHFHRFTTEIFMCTAGSGHIIVDGERVDFHPGVVVTVKPGVIHQPVSDVDLELTVIVSPPFMDPMDKVDVGPDVVKLYAD